MKVNGPLGPQGPKAIDTAGRNAQPTKRVARGESDRVDVSSGAKSLLKARDPEEVDTARIERLKQSIADGSFRIDFEAIADRMLKEEA